MADHPDSHPHHMYDHAVEPPPTREPAAHQPPPEDALAVLDQCTRLAGG